MTETLCDSGAVKLKAGVNVSTSITAAQYTQLINEAEGFLSTQAKYDFVTNYSSVSTIGKTALQDGCSSYAALGAINYDMSGFTSRTEAQTMLDVNWSKVVEVVNLIKDDKYKSFVVSGVVN